MIGNNRIKTINTFSYTFVLYLYKKLPGSFIVQKKNFFLRLHTVT